MPPAPGPYSAPTPGPYYDPAPTPPTGSAPPPVPEPRSHDPLAVIIGNASLLSVGYLMMRRGATAFVTALVTLMLLILHVILVRSLWFEILLLVWWVALIGHGWFLARRNARRVSRPRQRLIALGITIPVLLAVGFLRFDAAGIERSVVEARNNGDCAQANTALDKVWFGHRVVDAPLTVRGEQTSQACQLLQAASGKLTTALGGKPDDLKLGFDALGGVLTNVPGHEKMVDKALDGFLGALPTKNHCETVAVTDWLRQRPATKNSLDRSSEVIAKTAPAALIGCADGLMTAKSWTGAKVRYQQLIDQYAGHELVAKAQEGVKQATLAIELANVRSLLSGSTKTQPTYCSKPAPYSGAAPYNKGVNRSMVYGNDPYANRLPAEWKTADAADAVLVVCVGDKEFGTTVQNCPYKAKPPLTGSTNVAFHKIAIPVKAYELRTGKVVVDTKVEIAGTSCPAVLQYTSLRSLDLGPPADVYVSESDADVHAGFAPVITP